MGSPVELVGNALCLDFANTVNSRPAPARDRLDSSRGLRTWLAAVGYDDPEMPEASDSTLAELRELREDVYALLHAVLDGQTPSPALLAAVVGRYAKALPEATWTRAEDRVVPEWSLRGPAQLGKLVTASTLQLIQDGPLDRLGECPACGWLFLDTSRNGRRRWCSMATCGSRDKSARYFDRAKRSRA